jgi:hypothetical protein
MRSFGMLAITLALTILLAPQARGQSASASISVGGQVSGAVFISIAPGAQLSNKIDESDESDESGETSETNVTLPFTHSNLDRQTIRLSIHSSPSGGGDDRRLVSIPLLLRSNVGYTLTARANSNGMTPGGLCVAGVRATGRHVARGAANAVNVATCVDATAGVRTRHANGVAQGFSATLLQGPAISLSGTPDSPFNALEVSLLLELEPSPNGERRGGIELILSATPGDGPSAATNDAPRR